MNNQLEPFGDARPPDLGDAALQEELRAERSLVRHVFIGIAVAVPVSVVVWEGLIALADGGKHPDWPGWPGQGGATPPPAPPTGRLTPPPPPAPLSLVPPPSPAGRAAAGGVGGPAPPPFSDANTTSHRPLFWARWARGPGIPRRSAAVCSWV